MSQKKYSKRLLSDIESSSENDKRTNKKQKGQKSSEREERDKHKEKR
jgi:hypothetical protein